MYKTNTCGELRASHQGMEVTLAGWVNRRRVLGGINFVDLRDRFGMVQVVTDPTQYPEIHQALEEVRPEWVIQVEGMVRLRPEGLANPNMPTGELQISCQDFFHLPLQGDGQAVHAGSRSHVSPNAVSGELSRPGSPM